MTDPAPSGASPAPPLAPAQGGLRVLFVEDSEFDCQLLIHVLRQAGWELEHERVENEAGMRAALARGPWDAVISDHVMPGFSSTQALQAFKSAGLDIPFLIVSAEIGEDVAVEAMLAGADDYILKSRLARLVPALGRSLGAAQARRERRAAEAALRTSEAQLRGIATNLPGVVFRIGWTRASGSWNFEYASEGAWKRFGIPPRDLLEHASAFLARVHAADRPGLQQALADAAEAGADLRWEGRIQSAHDGATRWAELAGTCSAADAQRVAWEGVIIDATARKSAQEALERSREELRALSAHLERIKEEERKAIAREIHDDIGGIMASLKFDLAWLREQGATPAAHAPRLEAMAMQLDAAQKASDRIMRNLRPSILDQGIVAALEWQARDFTRRYGAACRFHANREHIALAEEQCTALFRVCQEALTNIVKHAAAKSVTIDLFESGNAVTLEVADDGVGVLPESLQREDRFGIRGMRERAARFGGWLELSGGPGRGTVLMVGLPHAGSDAV